MELSLCDLLPGQATRSSACPPTLRPPIKNIWPTTTTSRWWRTATNRRRRFGTRSSESSKLRRRFLLFPNTVTLTVGGLKLRSVHPSRPEVNATSLSFFLVMPVQRIARYPLLLQTIQKHTDRSHPAYSLLEQTAHTSIALNCRINEYKRFREVGEGGYSVRSGRKAPAGCQPGSWN